MQQRLNAVTRSIKVIKADTDARFKNPGDPKTAYYASSPEVERSASAWVKSVFDPAHARSYGCVGIPDINRNPSVVCSGRIDLHLSSSFLPSRGKDEILPTYVGKQGGDFVNVTTIAPSDGQKVNWSEVYCAAQSNFGLLLIFRGDMFNATYTPRGQTVAQSGDINMLIVQYRTSIKIQDSSSRAISCSITLEQITNWSDVGGYFTAGHLPVSEDQVANSGNTGFELPEWSTWDNWVTYSAGSAAGAYAISRPRNLDQMLFWVEDDTVPLNIGVQGNISLQHYGNHFSAWDAAFVRYFPVKTDWVLRCTLFENREVILPYNQGGQDGARMDKNALHMVLAMCDVEHFIYPASANDLAKVLGRVVKTARKYRKPILAAMGVAGSPAWLTALIKNTLLRK